MTNGPTFLTTFGLRLFVISEKILLVLVGALSIFFKLSELFSRKEYSTVFCQKHALASQLRKKWHLLCFQGIAPLKHIYSTFEAGPQHVHEYQKFLALWSYFPISIPCFDVIDWSTLFSIL